tara:strand:+ start:3705 stop:4235 length:531 start_codon:yes stop_codon:yes gene_type:complete
MSQIKVNSIVPVAGLSGGASGGIIQLVTTTKTDTFSTSATSPTTVTGMSLTITPQSASNKIIVFCQISGGADTRYNAFKMQRGTTDLAIADADGVRTRACFTSQTNPSAGDDTAVLRGMGMHWCDTPNTTSATTYNLKAWIPYGSATVMVNRCTNGSNETYHIRGISTMTVLEVSG